MFDEAMEGFVGAVYEPCVFATQVVKGANYCFICKSTLAVPNPSEGMATVFIYKDVQAKAVITHIERII